MRAITRTRYGTSGVLELRELPVPVAGHREVLVQVHAAGLARGVLHVMSGEPYLMRLAGFGILRPKNPVIGMDVAGVVVATGSGVTRLKVGDEVFGVGVGTFAEFAVATEEKLALKPSDLPFVRAAAMSVSGLTALKALDAARVVAGSAVLINGASGSVGTYAVQMAAALGAEVTGVASSAKLDLVKSLGAHQVIDYAQTTIADEGPRYDVVIDIGGMTTLSDLRRVLTRTGTLVIVGGEGGGRWSPGLGRQAAAALITPFTRQSLKSILNTEHHTGLERLAELAAGGQMAPAIERTYPLAEAVTAVRRLEIGDVRGQLAIVTTA